MEKQNNLPAWGRQRYMNTGQPQAGMTETLLHTTWVLCGPCQPFAEPEMLNQYW
jgi:hypothetical protein